jgi:uncharacterized protein (DUF1330 family)
MTAYLIVNYDVTDPDLYKEYQAGAGPALKVGTDCEVLVFDQKSAAVEGEPGHQTVVLKFDSVERAKAIYDSGDYQAVVGKRHSATKNHFAVLVEGMG